MQQHIAKYYKRRALSDINVRVTGQTTFGMAFFFSLWSTFILVTLWLTNAFAAIVSLSFENQTRTDQGLLSIVGNAAWRYEDYKRRYANCTHINGNLEITHLDQFDQLSTVYDLGFLSQIREVSGYVLIHKVCVSALPLNNLRVIRGKQLLQHQTKSYALYVGSNYCQDKQQGLEEINLTSLREIVTGDTLFEFNSRLCFVDTIEWSSITSSSYVVSPTRQDCASCDESCPKTGSKSHCWGPGANMCQKLPEVQCSNNCANRCFGPGQNECCAAQCIAGCSGPTPHHCLACKSYKSGRECVDSCPSTSRYNPDNMLTEVVPPKVLFDHFCVEECPAPTGEENGLCVLQCSKLNETVKNGKCTPCGDSCPIVCKGMADNEYLTPTHVEMLSGCNIVDGSIIILESSFVSSDNLTTISVTDLQAMENVTEVSGYVVIESPQIQNFSFLRNLRAIRGETTNSDAVSLRIRNTSAESLELRQLREIGGAGGIHIERNERLCYVQSVNWALIAGENYKNRLIFYGSPTAEDCVQRNLTCDPSCTTDGCWGSGKDKCLSCSKSSLDGVCINSCSEFPLLYDAGKGICKRCDQECAEACTGPDPQHCVGRCRHYYSNQMCLAACPDMTYPDANTTCQSCHIDCLNCTGSRNILGPDGCSLCRHSTVHFRNGTSVCLSEWDGIPDGFYTSGTGLHAHYMPCDESCLGSCSGPTNQDCYACKAKLRSTVHDADAIQFCYVSCPVTHIYSSIDLHTGERLCFFDRTTLVVALCISIPLALAVIAGVIIRFYRNHKNTMTKLSVQMSSLEDQDEESIPLTPRTGGTFGSRRTL